MREKKERRGYWIKGRRHRKKEGFSVEGKRKGMKKLVRAVKGRKKGERKGRNKGRIYRRKGRLSRGTGGTESGKEW